MIRELFHICDHCHPRTQRTWLHMWFSFPALALLLLLMLSLLTFSFGGRSGEKPAYHEQGFFDVRDQSRKDSTIFTGPCDQPGACDVPPLFLKPSKTQLSSGQLYVNSHQQVALKKSYLERPAIPVRLWEADDRHWVPPHLCFSLKERCLCLFTQRKKGGEAEGVANCVCWERFLPWLPVLSFCEL